MFSNVDLLLPFIIVAYTMWATPGPNNMMLAYSGARFGILPSMPHVLGIVAGTLVLNGLAVLGLKPLIDQWPVSLLILKIVGSIWLIKIGWKMANAATASRAEAEPQPMRFHAALLFQFANPKAISATLALVSLLLVAIEKDQTLFWISLIIIPPLVFVAILPWLFAGRSIRRFLSTPKRWKWFSWVTGGLTASCAIFLWL